MKAVLAAVLMGGAGLGFLSWQTSPARRDLAEAREALDRRQPVRPATSPSDEFDEADGAESTWTGDVDGDGRPDHLIKRYWTGSGSGYELLLVLDRVDSVVCYTFSGGERGTAGISVGAHYRGLNTIVVPQCLVDRGADTVHNFPSVYILRNGLFELTGVTGTSARTSGRW